MTRPRLPPRGHARSAFALAAAAVALAGGGCAREASGEAVQATPERIARGAYVVNHDVPLPEGGVVWAPNITPDPDTGIGSVGRELVKRALRDGVRLDGKRMAPPMSTYSRQYAGMTHEDLDALVAYLFAQKPVSRLVPARKLDPETQSRLGEP